MGYKRLLFLASILLTISACKNSENSFTVLGDITNMPEQNVLLEELGINDIRVVDSARSNAKGHFEISGSAPEPGLYRLHFSDNRYVLLAIDKGNMKVSADWNQLELYSVAGSAGSESLRKFISIVRDNLRDINTMGIILDSLHARGNDSVTAAATKQMDDIKFRFTRFTENFADTTASLPVALFCARMLNPKSEKDFLLSFAQGLARRFPRAKMAKEFEDQLGQVVASQQKQEEQVADASPAVGTMAPDISLQTADGKTVALSSLKGKYVLLDFWASWCPPCRRENPNVVANFNKYKGKNFTIYAVSLDNDKAKWQEAVAKDKLAWTQVSDLKGWDGPVVAKWGIQAIPANFLIDPSGKIIERDLKGEALGLKLAELIK